MLAVLAVAWTTANIGTGGEPVINAAPAEPFDYAQPALFTGTVYESASHKKVLFKFRRTAVRSGATVRVERKFTLPDGTIAATEKIVYESGRMVSCEMKELQAGLWGNIQIKDDPKNPARQKITINHGHEGDAKRNGTTEDLSKDVLIDDTIYPFMLQHWDELMRGGTAKFRFVSLEWEKTFGFKLSKSSESTQDGTPVVTIKMEPTNLLVAHLINPLIFTVEKSGLHRVVEYWGRTTPRIKSGKSWKYLDADTVFDWK